MLLEIKKNRPLISKNNAIFISCITKINNELIEDVDDLDIVIPMYNLLEYSKNYKKTIGSLYNYYRDELSDDADNNNFDKIKVVNSNGFKYKNKITGNTYDALNIAEDYVVVKEGTQEIELATSLKYLGNFWRALNMPLISCEISLELKWNRNCIITSLEEREVDDGPPVVRYDLLTGATLAINDCKLYIPVVTLSKDDEIKLLTNLKSGFTREIEWNKYRSQMSTEEKINNLNILIDPTFTNVNRLFVLAYQTADDRQSFSQFYDENNTNYGVDKNTGVNNLDTIKSDTRVLKPNLCDYADSYILVDGTIRAEAANEANAAASRLALKNCARFTKCNLEINDEHVVQQKI